MILGAESVYLQKIVRYYVISGLLSGAQLKFMKKSGFAILLFLVVLTSIATSCEKHDGIDYHKAKCEAELNGMSLIDQSRFDGWISNMRTPLIDVAEDEIFFESKLSVKRGEMPLYYVDIQLYATKSWEYLTEPAVIKFVDREQTDGGFSEWEYVSDYKSYCSDNKINFATIYKSSNLKTEIVKEGSFQITEYDLKKHKYKGAFSLLFGEGTLTGKFSI